MQKIKDLHTFIINLNLFAAEQMESVVDDLTVIPACRPNDNAGELVIAEKDYTATFFIERYPHGQVSEDQLLAQVSAWLVQNDADRTIPFDFSLNIEVMDAQIADLEFGIPFNELIIAQEDVAGDIIVDGVRYAL